MGKEEASWEIKALPTVLRDLMTRQRDLVFEHVQPVCMCVRSCNVYILLKVYRHLLCKIVVENVSVFSDGSSLIRGKL